MPNFPTPYHRKSLVSWYRQHNLTQPEMDEMDSMYDTAFMFMRVTGCALLAVGVPGNMVVISVLGSKSMRRNLTALFLIYLAVLNLFNLLFGLTRYVVVSFRGPDIRLHSETLCLLHTNLIIWGHLVVNWTILAVGLCKMAYVLVPDSMMKNLPSSFVHSVMLTMIVYGYGIVYMFSRATIDHDAESSFGLSKCEPEYLNVFALVTICCTFVIPELAMFVVNITTISAYHHIWTTASVREQKAVRVNYLMGIMLFVSDIQLLLAEVPYIVINTFKPLLIPETPRGHANYMIAKYLCVGTLYSNYALNCLTYCFFGGHFRRELRAVFRPFLSLCCDPGSRWVNSKASIFDEETRRESVTTTRLSLQHLLGPDNTGLEEIPPDMFDPGTKMSLRLMSDEILVPGESNSQLEMDLAEAESSIRPMAQSVRYSVWHRDSRLGTVSQYADVEPGRMSTVNRASYGARKSTVRGVSQFLPSMRRDGGGSVMVGARGQGFAQVDEVRVSNSEGHEAKMSNKRKMSRRPT